MITDKEENFKPFKYGKTLLKGLFYIKNKKMGRNKAWKQYQNKIKIRMRYGIH